MRLDLEKDKFIERLRKEIKHRNDLNDFRQDVFIPILHKFDGKVYNIRFIKALREACDDELIQIRELENDHIVIEKKIDKFKYTDTEQMYLKLILNEDGRINESKSLMDEMGKKWIENFHGETEERMKIIADWDFYMDKCEAVRKAIEEYSKIPYRLRQNVVFRNTFYLNR